MRNEEWENMTDVEEKGIAKIITANTNMRIIREFPESVRRRSSLRSSVECCCCCCCRHNHHHRRLPPRGSHWRESSPACLPKTMPRRRQGHFHVVRRANATSKTRNTIYNEEGKLSQPESVGNEEAQAIPATAGDGSPKAPPSAESDGVPPPPPPKEDTLWRVSGENGSSASLKEGFRYLHKKFKKMEAPSSEDAENGDQDAAVDESIHANVVEDVDDDHQTESSSKPASNPSLEALFQVTGHELQKIKCSEEEVAQSPGSHAPSPGDTSAPENGLLLAPDERELGKRLRRHVCPYCGLGCGKPSVLQKHVRAHTNERPYPCVPCGFAFKTKSNLYKHCKSRAHHLKVVDGGATMADVGDDADVIETDDSTNSDEEGATSAAEFVERMRTPDEAVASTSASVIYKPKFHSVAYLTASSRPRGSTEAALEANADCNVTAADCTAATADCVKRFALPSPLGTARNNGAVQKEGATIGLAKRRNEQFQLRLEIPGPRAAYLPSLSSSSASSSSSSSSSAASISSAATPVSAVTNRLPLPATAAGFPSPRHQRSPKLASPEYLQQHISNLISQNAAIVETLDPLWPRRYTRQSSVASSHNVDTELRSKERLRRLSEDAVAAPSQAKSKLALALLSATTRTTSQSTSATVEVLADAPYRPATVVTYRPPNKVAIVDDATSRRIPTPESDSGSIVKSLLMASGLNKTSTSSSSSPQSTRPPETHHPQNPEGSIIKDLLLKTRSVATTPTATCMRLSGGSISTSSATAVAPVDEPSSEGATTAGPYTCNLCHISYRKAENLEIHCAHYCQKGPRPQFASTPPPPPSPNVVETPPAGVTVSLSATLDTASAIPVQPTGSITVPKPRGRPRGSKNRPKYEAPPVALAGRVHSKSVSESAAEPPSKERPAFRRNSISGELSDSIKDILMSRSLFGSDGAPPTDSIVLVPPSTTATGTPQSADDGPILKKHLLAGGPEGDKSPPLKKRKIPEDALQTDGSALKKDVTMVAAPTVLSLKSLEQLSRYPMRPSAVRLFGGEVQICDGAETKKIIIDHKMQSMLPSGSAGGNGSDAGLGGLQAADTTSSVVATIAKPVHNSGGTVLQVQEAKSAPPVCIPVVAVARPLMATGTPAAVLLSPAPVATVAIDISQLKLGLAPKPALSSIVLRPDAAKTPTSVRTSVTVTDCTTSTSTTTTDSNGTSKRLEVPVIHIQDVPKTSAAEVASTSATVATVTTTTAVTKSLLALPRPTSLLLKNVHTSMAGMTLVSPETPRPKKKYGQCYINGQYYTYLELKQSTRVYYCNCRPQPMYVPQSVDPKLSMYSMWQTVPAEPDPFGLTPPQAMSLYASKPRYQAYAIAGPRKMPLVVTHSSYWTFQQKEKAAADGAKKSPTATLTRCPQEENASETQELESKSTEKSDVEGADGKTAESMERSSPIDNDEDVDVERTTPSPVGDPKQTKTDLSLKHRLKDSGSAVEPKRVRIFEGGFKSNEDYTYVRGRGRGKYVCEECGIRCKKPSMLKKHIRTHTDVRPYTCKHCNFSFKTKGNLTKHMKSKAHHKKCVVLGIVPVPVTIDDAQIDEEALARQERIEHQRKQFADDEDSLLEDDDDEDDEDEEEDDEDEGHEEYKEGEDEDDESLELDGQFEDASETPVDKLEPPSGGSPKPHSEQEIAKSLLELGQTEPTLTSSASLVDIAPVMAQDVIETPRSLECVGEPCDEREELIGNPRVVWSSSGRNLTEVTSSNSGLGDRLVRTMDNDADVEGDEYPVRPVQCLETMDEDDDESGFTSRPLQRTDKEGARSTLYLGGTTLAVEETDQPMDLSMPHSRPEDGYDDVLEEDRPKRIDDGGTTDLHALNPYYNAPPPQYAPEPERHRGSSPRCYENISPAGSVELHRQLPLPAHSPYQPAAPPMEPVRDWTSKPPTPPPPPPSRPSVLHTYLSEQPPSKRMAMAAPPRGGSSRRHRSSSTSSACGGRKSPTLYSSPVMFGFASTASSPPPPLPPPSSARAESPPEILSPVGLSDGPPSRGLPPVGISNLAMYIHRSMDDGKCICTICNKAFSKPSHLRLHVNIHYFERPFRCDSCAISFRTKGHLQKHKRSVSHYNKVNMNMTFGTPTTDNPRPFKCEDCKIAFRIHGHLAKHLRSKMHIMKLECLGKLPFGTYAEIERSGANLNEIDTTDCENSLESLQVMAHRLVEKDPTVQRWPRERTISGGSCDDQSDGLPYVESPVGSGGGVAAPSAGHYRSQSVGDDGCASPDFADAGRLVMWSQRPFESNLPPSPDSGGTVPLPGIKLEPAEGSDIPHLVDPRPGTVATVGTARRQDGAVRLELGQRTSSAGSLVQDYEDISDDDESEVESPRRGGAVCRICGEVVKSAKFLQLHMFVNHVDGGSVPKTGEEFPPAPMVGVARKLSSPPLVPPTATSPSWRLPAYSTLPAAAVIEEQDYVCELCSEVYPNGHTLKQHMMMHARLRPYICELCDAGFTTSHYLKLHLQTHQQGKVFACQECHQSFGLIEELERHVDHVHPSLDGEQVR